MRLGVPKRPVDVLRDLAAPRDLVEWVRKLPPQDAPRIAWIDVPRADWLPYIAALRGVSHDAIVRAASAMLGELAQREASRLEASASLVGASVSAATTGAVMPRLLDILRAATDQGVAALAAVEPSVEDLRLAMIAHGDAPNPPAWSFWAKLVLELARASRRGNPLIGVALALRMLVDARGRRANTDLIARFRDKLTLGG